MEDGRVGEVKIEKSMRNGIAALSKDKYMKNNSNGADLTYEKYLTNFNNMREAEAACDAEAVRVAKSLPRFIPGKQQGKPVNVWYSFPVRF